MDVAHRAADGCRGLVTVDDLLGRCNFPPPGSLVRCGVSGGADSSALLALAVAAGCAVTAVHVDHGLREGSDREARRVAVLAERFGAAFESHTARVEPGPNLEARARAARYAVLGDECLVGHTADDQAESVLLALIRGSGPAGLAGADPARRPILGLRRAETVALCAELGIVPVDDPSNAESRFRRNRVRNELLPLLADIADRDIVPILCRTATLHGELAEVTASLALAVDPTDCAVLRSLPRPIAGEAIRRWWRTETATDAPPDGASVDRVLSVARGEAVACELPGGWRVARSRQRLRLVAPVGSVSD